MRCGDRASIIRYYQPAAAGEPLDGETGRAVERHLASCPACARLGEALAPVAHPLSAALAVPAARCPDCPDSERLRDYAHHALPARPRRALREHIVNCEACMRRTHLLGVAAGSREAGRLGGSAVRPRVWAPALAAAAVAAAFAFSHSHVPGKPAGFGTMAAQPAAKQALPSPSAIRAPLAAGRSTPAPPETRHSNARQRLAAAPRALRVTPGTGSMAASVAPEAHPARIARRAGSTPPIGEPRRISARRSEAADDTNLLCVRTFDLAFPPEPEGPIAGCQATRRLIAANELEKAAGALTASMDEESVHSPALVAYISLLYKTIPGRDRDARATLASTVGSDTGVLTPDDEAIRIVRMANGLLPQPTDPELQEILSSTEGSKPAFEQLILAAIVLDRSGHRGEARAALRAAADWLDLDERLKAPQLTGDHSSSA